MNPVIPPRPDISYVGVTNRTPPSGGPGGDKSDTSGRRREPPPVPPHPHHDNDYEAREEMRMRELEEARARAAQMEKTMRWWSDCTANWRDKWSKVRNERNKAREEVRQLRTKLETVVKEYSQCKKDKRDLVGEVEMLKKQLESFQSEKERASVVSSSGSQKSASDELLDNCLDKDIETNTSGKASISPKESTDFVDKLLSKKEREPEPKDNDSCSSSHSGKSDRIKSSHSKRHQEMSPDKDPLVQQKMAMLQLRLDEAQKTIQVERDEKTSIVKTMENLQSELTSLKSKYDDVKKARQDAIDQLSKIQDEHEKEVSRINLELEDESCNRNNMDKRLGDMRIELEKLQAENAQEWGKRERLETEKLALERENKQLHHEIENLKDEIDKKSKATVTDAEMKTLQIDYSERTKELSDLKHAYSKNKKLFQEKTTELEHAFRRSEQYEQEVKKLRCRIEELKRDLANAEDEVDQQANQIRRIQRSNDELQELNENLQVQVEHLGTRLKRTSSQSLIRSASLKTFDPSESTDGPTDSEGCDD